MFPPKPRFYVGGPSVENTCVQGGGDRGLSFINSNMWYTLCS